MEKTQIRQGWPWPDRDQTMTGLNFGVTGLNFGVTGLNFSVTHPPKKTIILWICLANKNMWNVNWVRSVQLLVTEMIVMWLRMEDSKHWIHPNSNVHLWLKKNNIPQRYLIISSSKNPSMKHHGWFWGLYGYTTWQHHVYPCCGDELVYH